MLLEKQAKEEQKRQESLQKLMKDMNLEKGKEVPLGLLLSLFGHS